jgi:hypothetical protein
MKYTDLKNKKILLILQRDWGVKHGFEIAKKLKNSGVELATLVFKPSVEGFIETQKEVKFNYILKNSEIEKHYNKINQESGYNIKMLLNDFKINSIWESVYTLREQATSFKKYPFSYEQNLNDKEIENYIVAYAFKIKELVNNFSPDIIIGYNLGDLRHLLLNKIATINKIPFLFMSDTKVQNIGSFYYDLDCEKSFFKSRIKKLNESKTISANKEKAKKYILEHRTLGVKTPLQIKNASLDKSLIGLEETKIFFKRVLNNFKNKQSDYDNPKLKTIIRDYLMQKISIYKNKRIKYDSVDIIDNFVFFPLQHTPEAQLGMLNPVHDNQLNTAKVLARFLPRNLTLVVKNHPWMYERRTESFLTKFKNTLNVKLIDHRIPNEIIYKKMDYMVSLCGTSIFEAAILKKPTIQIGSLKMMNDLPNLFLLDRLEDVPKLISQIDKNFKQTTDSQEYDKKLINYISAAYDVGFDFRNYEADLKKNKDALEYMWKIYLREIVKILKLKKFFTF